MFYFANSTISRIINTILIHIKRGKRCVRRHWPGEPLEGVSFVGKKAKIVPFASSSIRKFFFFRKEELKRHEQMKIFHRVTIDWASVQRMQYPISAPSCGRVHDSPIGRRRRKWAIETDFENRIENLCEATHWKPFCVFMTWFRDEIYRESAYRRWSIFRGGLS